MIQGGSIRLEPVAGQGPEGGPAVAWAARAGGQARVAALVRAEWVA